MSPTSYDPYCDLFINKMKKAGVIDEAVFSMYIDLKDNQSKMTLGGFDLELYSLPGQELQYHDIIPKTGHWMVTQDYMSTTQGGNNDFKIGVKANTIVDSGTSYILMPLADREALISHLGLTCWGSGIV